MKRIHLITQALVMYLALITSAVSAQIPSDTIPSAWNDSIPSDPDGTNGTPTTTDPYKPFISDELIIPVVPYEPQPEVEPPVLPLDPFIPGTEKTTVNPEKPGIPTVDNKYTVGTAGGSLTVNGLGAAEYALPIEAPNGGPLMPVLSLVYNSQNATNGIAGYGVSLSGFSAITRGEKTIFNNKGSIGGVTYTETDNLFLDGKRLVLISGTSCQEGAQYCLEGDPYTKVTAHGVYNASTATTWFEVKTPDGMTYEYGKTSDSRLSFKNKAGRQRISSWHINRTEDVKGNYMTVSYLQDNYYPYPSSVLYGMNSVKDRGLVNKIDITYEAIGATASDFFLEDQRGTINKRIATITSSSNDQVFRKYCLTYDVASDKSLCRFARLTSIREENGGGDSLTPTQLTWVPLTDGATGLSKINDPTESPSALISFSGPSSYMAADVTGDGISDIIRLTSGSFRDPATFQEYGSNFLVISRSEVIGEKQVKYKTPIVIKLPPSINIPGINSSFDINMVMGGFHLSDIDGDGLNDLVFTERKTSGNTWNKEEVYIISGKDIVEGKVEYKYTRSVGIHPTSTSPIYFTCDFNGDGKDEILCLEKNTYNELYWFTSLKFENFNEQPSFQNFGLEIPGKPEKVFCGDYNNDGLNDMIVLYEEGYKIFYNLGGEKSHQHFNNSSVKTGTSMKNQVRIDQGDFNGDGLLDFVYNVEGQSVIWIAYNNGDGTFSNMSSGEIGLTPKIANEPDGHFFLRSVDMNRDGKSDILVCKAAYELNKFKNPIFKETQVKWLLSNGASLRLKYSYTKTREADADESLIFIGDFDGDGCIDLANSGSPIDRQDATVTEKGLNLYRTYGADSSTGRITTITDGLGNTSKITYSYMTSPDVYSKENYMEEYQNVNTLTLPLSVVKQLSFSNGVCGSNVVNYDYKDLFVEMTGAGVLGFGEVTKTMVNTGESSTDAVTDWFVPKWIPTKTKSTNVVDGKTSTVETNYMVQTIGNTYYSYEHFSTVIDMYGNKAQTVNSYDLNKGVILSQIVKNNDMKMYKKVEYSDYQQKSGVWLPGVMTLSQKHENDSKEYSSVTKYTYDDKGNVLSTTLHSGTDLELTTTATYDVYGNRLSSYSSGESVVKITRYNEFDPTGRFVVRSWQEPEAAINTFTYDLWGNVLTETDCSDSNNILTTTHAYDSWGRKISTTLPDETKVNYTIGWGKTAQKHHYSFVEETGKPWVLTWYDKAGNETSTNTFGPKNVLITKTTEYDNCGRVKQVTEQTGKLKVGKSFLYDKLGRVVTEKSSTGNEVTYTYANRSVTSSTNGRNYTKVSDAWGNLLSSSDPSGATVTYKYGSNGQPSSITTDGSTVSISYDCAGNKISVSDPDAGVSTYEYAADGTLLKQVDAKGVTTTNTYDALGRLSSTTVGNQTIRNVYGTSGYDKLRLVRKLIGLNTITYKHDKFGRVTTEVRDIQGSGQYTTTYRYDTNNRLSSVSYYGTDAVKYAYDDYGFKTAVSFRGKDISRLESYDGLTAKTSFMDSIVFTKTVDSKGLEKSRQLAYRNSLIDYHIVDFDTLTLNLNSRGRMGYATETFKYDNLDRLVGISMGSEEIMSISYARNGNILSKSGIGAYSYDNSVRPHAVTSVENSDAIIPSSQLLTTFNPFGLIEKINDSENNRSMQFMYGPDLQRCMSVYSEDGKQLWATTYLNHLEITQSKDPSRFIYYLDDNVIFINSTRGQQLYFLFKDHLGSILSAFDSKGVKVFEASYDAWGKQEIKRDLIGLRRGYTGHEMINEFGIINMNGRLYDPALGRFFSPDPFVQFPDFSQSYNRYSYCLNNPLKYTDPSGHLLTGIEEIVGISIFNILRGMLHAKAFGGNIIKAGISSLLSSPLCGYGIGQLFGEKGSVGIEILRAGTHGLASGVASLLTGGNFGSGISGFVSGASASLVGSYYPENGGTNLQRSKMLGVGFCVGGAVAFLTGGDFIRGGLQGLMLTAFNHLQHLPKYNPMGITGYQEVDGDTCANLPEVVITPKKSVFMTELEGAISDWSLSNTFWGCVGESMKNYGCNSTRGSNGMYYFKADNYRSFYGNQYVKTEKLTNIGARYVRVANVSTVAIGFAQIGTGLAQDYTQYQKTGSTNLYNSVKAAGAFGGSYMGMEAGIKIGAYIGFTIGINCAGVGAVPCTLIGAVIGGFFGSIGGELLGTRMAEYIYE